MNLEDPAIGKPRRPTPAHPLPPRPWRYSERLADAVRAALLMHAAQARKGTSIPYASHLLGVCSIALDYGATEDEAIAAVLHDVIEDVHYAPGAREAVAAFGPEVLRIVLACTDAEMLPKPPWRERKAVLLANIAAGDASVLLVAAADKLHNARSIVAALRAEGSGAWRRFNAEADSLWYYRTLVETFRGNPAHPVALVDELARTVDEMVRLAAEEGPGRPPKRLA